MPTTVNKDGSITTTAEDVELSAPEAKVVEPDEKPAATSRSRAESK